MTWFKVDDRLPRHPKIRAVGGDAAWLYICGGCYCAEWSTDGRIPKGEVFSLSDRRKPMVLAAQLVDVGLWEDGGDCFVVHDFLEYNPSRAEVAEQRANRSAAGKRGGKQSAKQRRSKAASKSEASASAIASDANEAKLNPVPVPPIEPNGSTARAVHPQRLRESAYSALVGLFGPATTKSRQGFYGKTVTELLDAGASPEEIVRRGEILQEKDWNESTPQALAKHWDTLGERAKAKRTSFD